MAKHNKVDITSELETVKADDGGLVSDTVPDYTYKRALLKLMYPVIVQVRGRVSGKLYTWISMGQVVEVDVSDLEYLLDRKVGIGGCCGFSKQPNKLFELVGKD